MSRVLKLTVVLVAAWTWAALPVRAQDARPVSRLVREGEKYRFLVDGRPFLMLGGQVHNSSATDPRDLEPAWTSLTALHANTAEVPLYWELIEPEPGRFDFHLIDAIVSAARAHGLRLVFLWFATWKNGEMHYTPEWVKRNREKYTRVRGPLGDERAILSPLCEACREADATGFAAVMEHLRGIDESERTVIMVQVENESGFLGTDRDYSEEATRLFRGPVPAELMGYLEKHREILGATLKTAWAQANFRKAGTWREVFGDLAAEAYSAWYVARYVDAVSAAGKRAYDLPLYVNNWLVNPGNERAGRWPSGGPTEHVLDIWKAAAPHIDLLAPDIYNPLFDEVAGEFTRPDNPLFVPEVRFSPHFAASAFSTFAAFNGIGFSPFGIDHAVENGNLTARAEELEDSYRVLAPLLPLILRFQYTGRLHAIVQGEAGPQAIALGDKLAAVVRFSEPYTVDGPRGRGMIIALAPDDFVVVGARFSVDFREREGPPRDAEFLSLEEGTFENELWRPARWLNGDELHVTLPAKARILRVRLIRPR